MLLYPAMSDLLKEVKGRYLLVNLAARRAREIAEYAEEEKIELPEKPVSLAVNEIAEGKLAGVPIAE